jgi:hypothetical protein
MFNFNFKFRFAATLGRATPIRPAARVEGSGRRLITEPAWSPDGPCNAPVCAGPGGFTVAGVLADSWRQLLRRSRLFFGAGALIALMQALPNAVASQFTAADGLPSQAGLLLMLGLSAAGALSWLAVNNLLFETIRRDWFSQRPSGAVRAALRRMQPMFWLGFLVLLAAFAVPGAIAAVLVSVAAAMLPRGHLLFALAGTSLCLALAAAAFVAVTFCLAVPACTIGRAAPLTSMKASRALARGHRLKLLALWAVQFGAAALLCAVVSVGLALLSVPPATAAQIAGSVADILIVPWSIAILAVSYLRLAPPPADASQG